MIDKTKILYVDDEEMNTLLFEIIFSEKYDVILASDGQDALNVLDKEPEIAVVISDMKMPGLSGVDFIKTAYASFPDKRYFLLSGMDITAEIQYLLEEKIVISFIKKPFNLERVEKLIETHK